MEDDYVETSDQDELEESRGLFYQNRVRPRQSESSRETKRRKISHVYENASKGSAQSPRPSQSNDSPGPARVRDSAPDPLFSDFESQSPVTDFTEPLSVLFEPMADSGVETPLSFPPSEDEKENDDRRENEDIVAGVAGDDLEMSQDPLNLLDHDRELNLSPLPPSSAPRILPSPQHSTVEDAGDLLHFHDGREISPVPAHSPSPPPLDRAPSPLSPPTFPPSTHSPLFSPPPRPQSTDGDAELARVLHDDDAVGTNKRNLRKRGEHQRRPYTFDKILYMQQMKNVPEAVVTARYLEKEKRTDREQRRRDGYLSEEESQEQEYQPPSDPEEESQMPQPRIRQKGDSVTTGVGNELLPSMSESSDEDMRGLRKEARQIEKQKRRKEKEAKRAEKEREREEKRIAAEKDKGSRTKSFPVRDKEREARKERTKPAGNQRNATPGPSDRHDCTLSPAPEPGPSSGILHKRTTGHNEDDADMAFFNDWKSDSSSHSNPPRVDQFDYDDNVGSGPGSASPPPHLLNSPPPSMISRPRSRSRFTSQTTVNSGHVDDSDNDSSSDSGDAKENRQLKTLGRLYPRFMLPAFGVNTRARLSSQPREQGNQRQASLRISSDDEEDSDNLRPGLARVRVRRGNIRPIKGDTESEDDGTEMAPATFKSSFFPSSPRSPSPFNSRGQRNILRRRSVQPQPQRQNIQEQEIIEISSSSSEDSSSDETDVDDEEIAEFLQRSANPGRSAVKPSRKTVRNELLIDYMLARNVYIGGSSSSRRKPGKSKQLTKGSGSSSGIRYNTSRTKSSSISAKTQTSLLKSFDSNKSSAGTGGYRLDVVRPGHGGGRQSLLSFNNHRQAREASRSRAADVDGYSQSDRRDDEDDDDDDESQEDESLRMESDEERSRKKGNKNLTWKQKLKQRKEAERMHGVYIHVADAGTRLLANAGQFGASESGGSYAGGTRRKRRTTRGKGKRPRKAKGKGLWKDLSLNAEDEELHRALAPSSSQHRTTHPDLASKQHLPHRRLVKKDDAETGVLAENEQDEGSNSIKVDTDFGLLTSGQTFGFNTYIKRGLLYELLQLIHPTPPSQADSAPASAPASLIQNSKHPSYRAPHLSLVISLSNPLSDFLRDLPILCQSLGDFIMGLPDVDEEVVAREWRSVMRGAEDVLTGFMKSEGDEAKKKLQDIVGKTIGLLITQMHTSDFIKSTIDLMTFDVCWFVIEMLLRAGFGLSSSKLLSDACKILVQYLLEVDPGLRDVMTLIRDQNSEKREFNDSTSIVQREAELWVCLIHVLRPGAPDGPSCEHPLWDIIRKELGRRSSAAAKWTLQSNEVIWQTIAGVCALSQFSEHGLCKDKPSISEGWKIVFFALKSVQLKADSAIDQQLNSAPLRMKDRYFALIVRRCFFLVNCWKWAIESSFPVLNIFSGAFGTRKFRNLLHEKADFPEFLRTQRWGSCFEYSRRDSAFVLFVKLVVQRGIALKQSERPSPHSLEKNLTLITPLSSVEMFSKVHPPQGNELSMLYNRMAAIAVRIHLSPSDYCSRVQQARQYFNFRTSDDTSRMACIRSLMYVTQMMILEKLPLEQTEVNAWYIEIVEVLIKEYKELSGKEEKSLNRVRFLLNAVLGSLRHILNAYNDPEMEAQYPDLSLFDVVQKIGREAVVTDNTQTAREFAAVIRTFLSLRDKVVSPPERPPIEPLLDNGVESNDNQESQEYGEVDIDMNDPALDELLGGNAISNASNRLHQDIEVKDRVVGKSLNSLTWLIYRCLKNMFEGYPEGRSPSPQVMENVDGWIDTWIQCASIAIIHSQSMTWFSLCLDVRKTWTAIGDVHWRRRIDIRVALNILRRAPMSYADSKLKDYFIETLFNCLIPVKVTVEHDFLSCIFSIDGLRHPLLRNLPVTLPPYPKILALSKNDFTTSRDKFLRGILDNIEQSLHDEENESGNRIVLGENVTNKKYGDFLAKFFYSLKEMYSSMPEGSNECQDYKIKCKDLCTMTFEDHPRIGTWRRMATWDVWWKGLN
ncbi:Mus7/MMS22 family-domain-containing protein [Lentinula edodes]|uniref:Mus7/MMS22 family-domain-containing protein n=1 Tax=Lentinula edodes TaxID=5353 RepID=UPI001E8E521F|nr:Mus7/MMS22 family-domain-containing protein [Lentinula edodes]KAH7873038.1 Mus7/MMS22 family-domain-containing protein [Lentinula edodes]